MTTYLVLIRGINVGGKNKVSMQVLKNALEKLHFTNISTYINSGNIILTSPEDKDFIQTTVAQAIADNFITETVGIKVLVVTLQELQDIVSNKPEDFGTQPSLYHSDVIFLMDIDAGEAFAIFSPREGVDKVWQGKAVIYSQRVSALRTKSRLNKIMSSPFYKSMTIRSWQTTIKLLELAESIH